MGSTSPSQKEYNAKFYIQWGRKFEKPAGFREPTLSETCPTKESMLIPLDLTKDEVDDDVIDSWVSPEVRRLLKEKAGETSAEKIIFLNKTMERLEAIKERSNDDDSHEDNPNKTQCNTYAGAQLSDKDDDTSLMQVTTGQGGSEGIGRGDS